MGLEQIVIIPFLYREDADPQDIQARLSALFGEAAYSLPNLPALVPVYSTRA
jgi:hypothetical protein